MAKQKVVSTKVEEISSKGFKTISENLPFHEFDKVDTIDCIILGSVTIGGKKEGSDLIPLFKVNDLKTGEMKFIKASYSIKEAVELVETECELNGKILSDYAFRFKFEGKSMTKDNKPINKFDTAYMLLSEYKS